MNNSWRVLNMFYTGRLFPPRPPPPPKVSPFILLYTLFDRKSTPFIYLQEIVSFLLALLGLLTDGNNRFGYPLYTSTGEIPTLIKVRTPFGPSLGV